MNRTEINVKKSRIGEGRLRRRKCSKKGKEERGWGIIRGKNESLSQPFPSSITRMFRS